MLISELIIDDDFMEAGSFMYFDVEHVGPMVL